MSASPIVPSDLAPVTSGATACDHLTELGATRDKMQEFLQWFLANDETGLLGSGFKEALIQQMLFDAAKKGWFLQTNASTGYLELIEKIPLAGLSEAGAVEGDIIEFNGTAWVVTTKPEIYLAPTSGGSTVPAVATGGLLSVAHGFSATPNNFRCYLECSAIDIDYQVGDRVDAANLIILRDTGGEQMSAVTVGANSSLVFAVFQSRAGAGGEYRLVEKASTFDRAAIDPSKWNVRFYATP